MLDFHVVWAAVERETGWSVLGVPVPEGSHQEDEVFFARDVHVGIHDVLSLSLGRLLLLCLSFWLDC